MAAAGLVVFCAVLLCLEGSPSKLKTLIQLHAQSLTTTPQEEPPGMVKAPTRGGHVLAWWLGIYLLGESSEWSIFSFSVLC